MGSIIRQRNWLECFGGQPQRRHIMGSHMTGYVGNTCLLKLNQRAPIKSTLEDSQYLVPSGNESENTDKG